MIKLCSTMRSAITIFVFLFLCGGHVAAQTAKGEVLLVASAGLAPRTAFGLKRLAGELKEAGYIPLHKTGKKSNAAHRIVIQIDSNRRYTSGSLPIIPHEGFEISTKPGGVITIIEGDASGIL